MTRIGKFAMSTAIVIALVVSVWLIGGCAMQRKLLMFPTFMIEAALLDADARPAGWQRWEIAHDQGITEAWLAPGSGVGENAPGPAVIFAHGNAELIDYNTDWVDFYRQAGVSVLLVEYRGYGRSDGSPSQERITADFVAAFDRLAEQPEVDAKRIIFHGRSIGGGVMCALSIERTPAAMILQSTFTSAGAMAAKFLYPPFLVMDKFDNLTAVQSLEGPLLIFHGKRDRVIPFAHGRKLHEAAPNSTFHAYNCDHNDFPIYIPQFQQHVLDFLRDADLID